MGCRFSLALQEMQEGKGQAKGCWRLRNEMGSGQQNTLWIWTVGKGINLEQRQKPSSLLAPLP